MAARRGPTARRRELGRELRRLREKSNLTIEEVARKLGCSDTKITRVESGHNSLPRVADLEKLLDAYGVQDIDDRDDLTTLHRDSLSTDWWMPYRAFMPSGMPMYVGLEQEAVTMRAYQPHYVFGLLQTENYTRSLFMTSKPVDETTTEFVETNVRLRMLRKEVLTRVDPVELRVILDEAALRKMIGGPEVMAEQYVEIQRITEMDHVTVQVLPLKLNTYRADANLAVLDFAPGLDSIVQVDVPGTIAVSDKSREVWKYNRRFDAMREGALAPSATVDFLQRLIEELI